MEHWIKNAVMATVTVVWSLYMLVGVGKFLFQDLPMPDPAIWGVPGMIWLTLNPPAFFNRSAKTHQDNEATMEKR